MDRQRAEDPARNYKAYVGPQHQYDFMGATQFRLLCSLGLRSHHLVLDFGCGSLRAGRLLLTYLDKGNYYGIEPNKWLIDAAIEEEIGRDLIAIKQPRFNYNNDFEVGAFDQEFDFIVAQSIFSHTGSELIAKALTNFQTKLKPSGIILAAFLEDATSFKGTGWIYPGCVRYTPERIKAIAEEAGLHFARLPWYHPRQTWYLLAMDEEKIPNEEMMKHLSGAVLFDFSLVGDQRKKINPSAIAPPVAF